jgi:hypothetical protein
MSKPPREKIPITEVLQWLHDNHPELHKVAEIDRNWLWIVADLRGDHNKAIRESIGRKEGGYGFAFAAKGHTLPSGNVAHWAHSCEHPTRFKNKHAKKSGSNPATQDHDTGSQLSEKELSEIASAFA